MRRERDCDRLCDLLRLNLHFKIKGSCKSYATVAMSSKYIDRTLVVFELSVSKQICFCCVFVMSIWRQTLLQLLFPLSLQEGKDIFKNT